MKPIIVFTGVDAKAGTTMIAQSVSEWIVENQADKKVLLLSLHGRPGTNYTDKKPPCLDEIRIPLENNVLNKQELIGYSRQIKGLHQIGGVTSILDRRRYTADTAASLISIVEDAFDLIVIDAGNELDNGLTVGALKSASWVFCVVTQQESYLDRFKAIAGIYSQLGIKAPTLIINLYDVKDSYGLSYIAKRLDTDPTSLLPVTLDRNGRTAEKSKQTLLRCGEKQFGFDIAAVALTVLERCGYPSEPRKRRTGWKSFT